MGGWISYLWPSGGEDLDEVDPALGLTLRQKQRLQYTWKLICKNKRCGLDLFLRFFADYPSAQNYFKAFKGKSLEELATSSKVRAHGTLLMATLTSVVENLDDPERVVQILTKTGENHHRHGVPVSTFVDVVVSVKNFLEEKLGREYDEFTSKTWAAALDVIISVIQKEMDAQAKGLDADE